MATNPSTLPENAGRITAPDDNYPYGSAKNDTTGTTGDGTPIRAPLMNDTYGFYQALLLRAGIVPSGNAETALVSQLADAVQRIGGPLDTLRSDVASAAAVNLTTGAPTTRHIRITGTTTISSFVVAAGRCYFVTFSGALTLTNGAPLVTNSGGDILTAAGDSCILRATAADVVEILCYAKASVGGVVHVRDQKAAGTNGGTFTNGAWRTRDLNTVLTNTVAGASLAANRVTLPAGTYEVMASAPSVDTSGHQARLYNITGAATLINGTTAFNSGAGTSAASLVFGRFTLGVTSDIELQHACQVTAATTGFGVGNTLVGQKAFEVYGDLFIKKVA